MVTNVSLQAGGPSDLRRVHRSIVLRSIFSGVGHSRSELAGQTGLSAMAITRIIRELIQANLVQEVGKRDRDGNPGRRQTDLQMQPDGAYVVGAVISAFGHEVILINAVGKAVAQRQVLIDDVRDSQNAIRIVSHAVDKLIAEAGINKSLVLGIGVAIAAMVDSARGVVVHAPSLGWQDVPLAADMSQITGYPVNVDSIANASNLTEQVIGSVRNERDVLLVHNSTTCGASYTQQGSPIRGTNHATGQIGHLPTRPGSLTCSCGANDCLDTYASGWSVLVQLGRVKSTRFDPGQVDVYASELSRLVAQDSPEGSGEYDAVFEAGRHLGQALIGISLVVDPEVIVLCGQLSKIPAYEAGCRSAWSVANCARLPRQPELIVGQVAPVQAAAFLALQTRLFSPGLDIEHLLQNIPSKLVARL